MPEFNAPAVRVGESRAFMSALWHSVSRRRKEWLRGLSVGDVVHVVGDLGDVYETTVRAISPSRAMRGRKRSREPQVWLDGHRSSFAAARIFKPGTAPKPTTEGA